MQLTPDLVVRIAQQQLATAPSPADSMPTVGIADSAQTTLSLCTVRMHIPTLGLR